MAMLIALALNAKSQREIDWFKKNPNSLPHFMTEEEKLRKNEIGKDFVETDPPEGKVRAIAEFDRMQGVTIRYPFGIPMTLIKDLAEKDHVYTLVENQYEENTVREMYENQGVNLDNCSFIHTPTDSYWTRDYCPWYISYEDLAENKMKIGIVDFPYNRPRPNDDSAPITIADSLGVELFGMNVIHTGGNYMCDSYNIAASTEIVVTESEDQIGITEEQVRERMEAYLGVGEYMILHDPNNTYIDHIDCWGKFLSPNKVLIREVPESHPQYSEIEETAEYFENATSAYGVPYTVYRVNTPQNQPYTNSLILNKRVFVPITGSSNDEAALEVYREAMPGYEVNGYTGSWESTDALHCRTRGVADLGLLAIRHFPTIGEQPIMDNGYNIGCNIVAHSGENIIADSTIVYYSVNDAPYTALKMNHVEADSFAVSIPKQNQDDTVKYYILTKDESGRRETAPFVGEIDPFVFTVGSTSIEENIASDFIIMGNYPNPFNPSTKITLQLAKNANVKLQILNIKGELIQEVFKGKLNAGTTDFKINLANYQSGIYFYKLTDINSKTSLTKRMLMIK